MAEPDGGPIIYHVEPEWMLLTKREYAAIHLSVPDSGTDWLDEMIRKANREKHAAAALQGLLAGDHDCVTELDNALGRACCQEADALIAALAEGEKL